MKTCTCWDIPRSDCCFCGAYDEWMTEWWQEQMERRSREIAAWAFGFPHPDEGYE